jgi:putative transposase
LEWPAWGHRKIWALLQADGIRTSQSTVLRALAARGLVQPPGYQRQRRELSRARREAFVEPVTRRNRVWQIDFSEFETAGPGGLESRRPRRLRRQARAGLPISTTKTARDAIAALEHARDHASQLLDRPLAEDCIDTETGEIVPLIVVTDNGSCFGPRTSRATCPPDPSSVTSARASRAPRPTGRSSASSAPPSTSISTATRSQTA